MTNKRVNSFRRARSVRSFKTSKPQLDSSFSRKRFPVIFIKHGRRFIERFPTTFMRNRGKTFMIDLKHGEFEAPMRLAIVFNKRRGTDAPWEEKVFSIAIEFLKDTIYVKGIQGNYDAVREQRALEERLKQPLSHFLMKLLEKEAKRNGYKRVLIVRPERLYWYKHPTLVRELNKNKRASELLNKKYREQKRLTESEKAELKALEKDAEDKIRKRIKALYENTANALGYEPKKLWFEKVLS